MSEPPDIHIETKYVEYTKVIKNFTKEKILDRYRRLLESAQAFIQEMSFHDHVVCNETMLMYAVLGYFSDIMRLKGFQEISRVNDTKIYAYETSWLLKRKPLQIKDSNDQKYAFCNEQFALSQITLWLNKDTGENGIAALAHDDLQYFSNMLFYHLKYRNNDPQILELMLVSFTAGRKYQQLLKDF
ncbi:hypothetical protein ACYULU_07440 [Breznakiellaceae bacterium SP9]